MKKRIVFIFTCLFFVLFSLDLYAESIDGPANVRDKPNGKILFSLNNNVNVECEPLKDNWYQIGINVYLKKNSLLNDSIIKKGEILYNSKGVAIGKTITNVNVYFGISEVKEKDTIRCEIVGFTSKNNIQEKSIIEDVLSKIIISQKNEIKLSELKEHIKSYYYNRFYEKNGISAYQYNDSWISDPSPASRIILVFYKETLVAVICKRKIDLQMYQNEKYNNLYTIYYINDKLTFNLKKELDNQDFNFPAFTGQ